MPIFQAVRLAITRRRIVTFLYDNQFRTCEPHVLGVTNGRRQLLCWQLEGGSMSGGIPEWRRFDVGDIKNLKISTETFPGPRPVPYPHSKWDEVILTV